MVWIALAFTLGIAAGWGVIAAAPAVWLARSASHRWNILLLLLIALLGAAAAAVDRMPEKDAIGRWATSGGSPVTLEGMLVGEAEYGPRGEPPRGWLRVERIRLGGSWMQARGKLQVSFPRNAPEFFYGDRLRLHGRLRSPRVPSRSSPNRFNEQEWLRLQHADGVLKISNPEAIESLTFRPTPWIRYRRWIGRFRRGLRVSGREFLGSEPAGLLEGLLLGEGRGISRPIWESFRRTGTVHVLVVSGLHVGLLAGIQGMFLSAIGVPRKIRCVLLAFLMISFCLLCGANPPIVRSTITGLLLCWAWAAGRAHPARNSIGAAAFLMLLLDPRLLADAGFQLSFASVSAILWVVGRLINGQGQGFSRRCLVPAAAASVAAWVATAPILIWHFRSFSLLAPAFNLIVVPWASLLIAVGFLVYASCVFFLPASPLVGAVFSQLSKALVAAVGWMAGLLLM